MKVGFLHSLIRLDEKLLLEEFRSRSDVELELFDDRKIHFNLLNGSVDCNVIVERCINHSRALQTLRILESQGLTCINSAYVASVCGDKLHTSRILSANDIPQPELRIAFTEESALKAIEDLGYPVVLKPAIGSWGRLLAKINDRDAAEAVLEHKTTLGSYHHSVFFIQKYIDKPARDIRCFVIGDKCVAAVYRSAEHWITDSQHGAKLTQCPITDEINDLALRAASAVGGGMFAIDLFESPQGLLVNDVSYTIEFRNALKVSDVNFPKLIVDYVLEQAK